jgi:F-box/TPR repeat protein Pof3
VYLIFARRSTRRLCHVSTRYGFFAYSSFRRFIAALQSVTKGGTASQLFDSRAAVHEKLGDLKAALEDARKVIDFAPHQWQGYARCARLFLRMKKSERAAKMVDYALERVKAGDTARRETLLVLKQEVIDFTAAIKRHISRTSYHFGNLPVEISHEIFSLLVDSDHALV